MRGFRHVAVVTALVVCAGVARAQQPSLDTVLHELDAASSKFQSAQADFRWDLYEQIVKQTTTQNGSIYFIKQKGETVMGGRIYPPGPKFFDYKNGVLRLFEPGTDHLTVVHANGKQAQYESFLTLGFGGSGRDLAKSWTVKVEGTEPLSDGSRQVNTVKLDLVPKAQAVANNFSHVTIWVDTERGISLKQQFFTPTGDYKLVTYSNIRYNQKVETKPYQIKTDGHTTTVSQ